jgi:hypothetical protein
MNKGFFKSCEDDISNVNVGTMIKKGNRSWWSGSQAFGRSVGEDTEVLSRG